MHRSIFFIVMLALAVRTTPLSAQAQAPLTPATLAALADIGIDEAEMTALVHERGFRGRLTAEIRHRLIARGVAGRLLDELDRGNRADAGRTVFDLQTGISWTLPEGWSLSGVAGGTHLVRESLAAGMELVVEARRLAVDTAALAQVGVHYVDELHRRRLDEIVADESTQWKVVGIWPMRARDRTGIHGVLATIDDDGGERLFCLSWFSGPHEILAITTRLHSSPGNLDHDLIVDEITRVLSGHARGLVPLDDQSNGERTGPAVITSVDSEGLLRRHALDGTMTTAARLLEPASDLAASLDGQLIWLGTGDRLVRWSLDERPPRPRLVANLPGPIESLHLDALEEQVLVWARSMDGRLRPHRIASGADTSVSVDSQEWICGSGFIDTGTRCMALARTDPDHFQLYEVAFEGPAPHTRRHGPVLHVPGLLGACLAADDQGVVLALTIEGPEGTTRKLQLLNALGDLLAEMPLTGLATPRCRLGRGGREVWLQTGDGALYSIPRQGGLPLRIRLDGLGAAFGVELER